MTPGDLSGLVAPLAFPADGVVGYRVAIELRDGEQRFVVPAEPGADLLDAFLRGKLIAVGGLLP